MINRLTPARLANLANGRAKLAGKLFKKPDNIQTSGSRYPSKLYVFAHRFNSVLFTLFLLFGIMVTFEET